MAILEFSDHISSLQFCLSISLLIQTPPKKTTIKFRQSFTNMSSSNSEVEVVDVAIVGGMFADYTTDSIIRRY